MHSIRRLSKPSRRLLASAALVVTCTAWRGHGSQAEQVSADPHPTYSWGTGPASDLLASVAADQAPAEMAAVAGLVGTAAPDFGAWAEALRATSNSTRSSDDHPELDATAARAALVRIALLDGRDDDAWRHLGAIEDSPDVLAALMPSLLPGVPTEFSAEPGGLPPHLPAGVTLTPALPPPTGDAIPPGWIEAGIAKLEHLRIGNALVTMSVELRFDGVDVRFEHESGGPVEFSCRIPSPDGFDRGPEYADFDRQESLGIAHPVKLSPGCEPWRLWGRFAPRRALLPMKLPTPLSNQLERGGLRLDFGAEAAGLESLAPALAELFGIPVTLAGTEPAANPSIVAAIDVELLPGPTRDAKLSGLISLCERALLPPATGDSHEK